jgi:hypothetical protein
MSDDPIIDTSHVDRYLRSRHRVEVMTAMWRPMAAGALGSLAVTAAVAVAVWALAPRFEYRTVEIPKVSYAPVEVPRVTMRDVTVNNLVPHDLPVEIPRIVEPLARTERERAFASSPEWSAADVRGRILREDRNGFILATDEGEKPFYPAKIGVGGKVEFDPSLKDVVTPFLGSLAFCRPTPIGVYQCTALAHDGREVAIPEVPIEAPL